MKKRSGKKMALGEVQPPAARIAGSEYGRLLTEIKDRVRAAQYEALRAVNRELVALYWDIGRMIVERQAGQLWGRSVVQRLAADLQTEFPGVAGFSASNLWRIKGFYEDYASSEKLAPLVREIGWSHNLVILERCKDPLEREFHIRMTRKFGWSKNVLIHQIESHAYEATLLGQTNFDLALAPAQRTQAKLAVKDEYTFDFLELGEEHAERELERALVARIEAFLRAMGGLFAFIGSQYRLEVDDKGECDGVRYFSLNWGASSRARPRRPGGGSFSRWSLGFGTRARRSFAIVRVVRTVREACGAPVSLVA